MPQLSIIIASTRPGRIGLPVANWVADAAIAHGGFDVVVLDLAEIDLPMFDEPKHPRFQDYEHQHTKDWSAQITASDAFVVVLPEYNHSFNAAIKNAIDYLHNEWKYKPVAIVAYGGVAAGTRAMQALKTVFGALSMTVLATGVPIPFVFQFLKDGVLEPNEVMVTSIGAMLDELVRVEAAVRPLRA
jgi:NAD(P)H-dependent FMN reductase